jgi:hypothetical protein
MNEAEKRKWTDRREALFAVSLPSKVIAEISVQLDKLDFERAMAALVEYRKELPYRGFYMTRFNVHYMKALNRDFNVVISKRSTETDGLAGAAAAQPGNVYPDSGKEQEAERRAFAALPSDFVAECERQFADWGIKGVDARAWRILCIDAYAGRDVSRYRRHVRPQQAEDDRVQRIHDVAKRADTIIAQDNMALRLELKDVYAALEACRKGVNIDVRA